VDLDWRSTDLAMRASSL